MSEELLNTVYRVAYWRQNELYCILCDFPSSIIQGEIDKLERLKGKCQDRLGYMPVA